MATDLAKAVLGSGDVRLDLWDYDNQRYTGLGDKLEADKFAITPDGELKRKTSKSRGAYGQNIASVAIAKPTKIALTLSSLSHEALAMQFQGIVSTEAQGAGAIATTITARIGKWVGIGKRNVQESGFAVKSSDDTATYVLGTDYEVNYVKGEIRVLEAGNINANVVLNVTGTASAYNGTLVRGGTRAQIRARVVFEGMNQVDGQYIEVEAYEAVFLSNKEFDWLADDFTGIELEGELNVPTGKAEPYVIRIPDAT